MILPNTIPTRTSEDLNSAADINALMENCQALADGILDEVRPVGSTYIQFPYTTSNTLADAFPEADEPETIFGGTWSETWGVADECDFANEGIFFKTRGDVLSQTDGENNARTDGLQTDMMQQITGTYDHHKANNNGDTHAATGAFGYEAGAYSGSSISATGGNTRIKFDSANSSGARTGKETRGRNRFIKIWRRTA